MPLASSSTAAPASARTRSSSPPDCCTRQHMPICARSRRGQRVVRELCSMSCVELVARLPRLERDPFTAIVGRWTVTSSRDFVPHVTRLVTRGRVNLRAWQPSRARTWICSKSSKRPPIASPIKGLRASPRSSRFSRLPRRGLCPGAAAALVDWAGPEIVRLRAFGIVHGALLRELTSVQREALARRHGVPATSLAA